MFKTLLTRLGLSQQEKDSLGGTVQSIKDVSEYLSDIVEIATTSSYFEAVAKAAPWAGVTTEALGEVLPPVKFAIKIFESLTKEHDPETLGHLACTLAYQNSIAQTVTAMEVPIVSNDEVKDLKKHLADLEPSPDIDFKTFSFDSALTHDFVTQADRVLKAYAVAVGYSEEQTRRLIGGVHVRFVGELKTLLSHGSLKDRFEPFTILMGLDASERQAYKALSEHAEYQRWLFEKAPVLKKEPYALAHIYVNTECGSLSWDEMNTPSEKTEAQKPENYRSPFSEHWGGRHALLETVIDLIADPKFRDAIVIQGAAGAGKSSFTLKLCSELLRQGLRPIRVRLKDLRLDLHVSVALPRAVRTGDEEYTEASSVQPDDLFLGGSLFKELVEFRGAKICPYVLILDGWDEISIAAEEGFRVKIAELLYDVRSEYLKDRKIPIRVILTGRPSADVSESKFFRDKTKLLTIRSLNPAALRSFVESLKLALEKRPILVDEGSTWTINDLEIFGPVLNTYKENFDATIAADKEARATKTWESSSESGSGSMAVLGLPLLAHLAIRLIAQWPGDPIEIIKNPTTLYRSLVDLTSEQSGKAADDISVTGGQLRQSGPKLRELVWKTAAAMTIVGEESIPYAELALRLGFQGNSLYQTAADATKANELSALMISFYFKGGQTQLGAEFVHKSFREYLFAEAIVQVLKKYGRENHSIQPRTAYWKDFPEDDPRFELSRELSELLSPHWLSIEVATHVERLLKWEISRSSEEMKGPVLGSPTTPLDLQGWESVRDGLAEIWEWWCEGVHLRPQPARDESGIYNFRPPYVHEMIKKSVPRDVQQKLKPQIPNRTTTMDSHLGDGLFRLTTVVHYFVAINRGWLEVSGETRRPSALWDGVSPIGEGIRKCQSVVRQGERSWTLFAPSGSDPSYFANYAHRINAAGWRPKGVFPIGTNLGGVDLRESKFSIPYSATKPGTLTIWTHANISNALLSCSDFTLHNFSEALGKNADFSVTFTADANFKRADLEDASFSWAVLALSDLSETNLVGARFNEADLEEANFDNSQLGGADFSGARIYESTSFDGAQTDNATLDLSTRIPARLGREMDTQTSA